LFTHPGGWAPSLLLDEVYFPTTGAEILRGDKRVEFTGMRTPTRRSKVLMAVGMGIFGHKEYTTPDPSVEGGRLQGTNDCWGDAEDIGKKYNPDWLYDPFGWRFPGALAGVGAVIFIYLLAKRLFQSEVAGLTAGFLLSVDGLAFTQSRIGTPDTYVRFMLASVYFLVSRRWLLSGVFLGAAAASKWIGAFTILPIVMYFAYWAFLRWRASPSDPRLKEAERVLLVGSVAAFIGMVIFGVIAIIDNGLSWTVLKVGGIPMRSGCSSSSAASWRSRRQDAALDPQARACVQIAASSRCSSSRCVRRVHGQLRADGADSCRLNHWWT
jgi:hypothetical protein